RGGPTQAPARLALVAPRAGVAVTAGRPVGRDGAGSRAAGAAVARLAALADAVAARLGIAGVAERVAVEVRLARVRDGDAVVRRVRDTVAVGVRQAPGTAAVRGFTAGPAGRLGRTARHALP